MNKHFTLIVTKQNQYRYCIDGLNSYILASSHHCADGIIEQYIIHFWMNFEELNLKSKKFLGNPFIFEKETIKHIKMHYSMLYSKLELEKLIECQIENKNIRERKTGNSSKIKLC